MANYNKREMPTGKRFSKDYQPKKKGRNPLSEIVRKMRADGMNAPTYKDVQEVLLFLISLSFDEIKKIVEDEAKPLLMRVVARELVGTKTGMEAAKYIIERVYGKPTQIMENYNENNEVSERPRIVVIKNGKEEELEDGE